MKKPKTRPVQPAKESLRGKLKSDFPKHTLEEALRVAKALHEKNGGQPLPPTDTAIAIGVSPGNSDFRILLSSSLKYGLTKGSYKGDRISLEDLAYKILEPKDPEEHQSALMTSALNPPTFQSIYDYYRGKKLPEQAFFQNTVIREFEIPREHAEKCVSVFSANMDYVGLVRVANTGRWLSSELNTRARVEINDSDEDRDANGSAYESVRASVTTPPQESESASVPNAIFIGHGKNKKPLEQLKGILDQYRIPYKVAIDEANEFRPISQKVADTMKSCGAAILVFTADEEFRDGDGNVVWRPSENVIYELGAASVLYGKRIIIFKQEEVHFPANFRDIGYINFSKNDLAAKTNELFRELIAFGLIRVMVGA